MLLLLLMEGPTTINNITKERIFSSSLDTQREKTSKRLAGEAKCGTYDIPTWISSVSNKWCPDTQNNQLTNNCFSLANELQFNCSLLKKGLHTVGRRPSQEFVVNSTLVSKEHLILDVKDDDNVVINVVGGITTINADLIDRRNLSALQKKTPDSTLITSTTEVTLGKNGVAAWIVKKAVNLKIQRDLVMNEELLRDVCVKWSYDIHSDTTHVITNVGRLRSSSVLEALVRQIPIVNEEFVAELVSRIELLKVNFEENFPRYEDYLLDSKFTPDERRKSIYETLMFVFVDAEQYEYLDPILSMAGATSELFAADEESGEDALVEFIKGLNVSMAKTILIKPSTNAQNFIKPVGLGGMDSAKVMKMLSSVCSRLSCFIIGTDDLFESMKQVEVKLLFQTHQAPGKRPQETQQPQQSNKKRRRNRVKALDSLDFFAGGGKFESLSTEESPKVQESIVIEDEQEDVPEAGRVKPETSGSTHRRRPRVESLENMMLNTFSPTSIVEETSIEAIDEDLEKEVLLTKTDESHTESLKSNKDIIPVEPINSNDGIEPVEDIRRDDGKSLKRKAETQSLSSAIVNAKRRADERLKEELAIDIDAADHLRDLAIVEEVAIPMRDLSTNQTQVTLDNAKWASRKNFKVFVKNSCKKRNRSPKEPRNLSCLKDYVQFDVYDPTKDFKITKMDEEMLEAIQRDRAQSEEIERNELTGGTVQEQAPRENKLFVDSDYSDDDNDELAGSFNFRDANDASNDGLDMPLRVQQDADVFEPMRMENMSRNTEQVSEASESSGMGISCDRTPVIQRISADGDNSDDDDDDDDDLRFKFQR